jgi:hypothetical protein
MRPIARAWNAKEHAVTRSRATLVGGLWTMLAMCPAPSSAQRPAPRLPRSAAEAATLAPSAQRVLDSRAIHLIRRDTVVAVPADSVSAIRLAPGEFLGQRTAAASHVELRQRAVGIFGGGRPSIDTLNVLPFTLTATTADRKKVRLRPVVISEGLSYVRDSGSFLGSMLIALEDQDAPGDNENLSGPIRINVSSQGNVVSPDTLDVTHTNLPPIRVRVRASPALDSVAMRVIPTFDMRGENVWLAVRPTLLIPNLRRRAPGLGVARVPFQVTVAGRTYRDSIRVSVSTNMGSLDRDEVMIPPGGSAIVHLRTEGSDSATVRASSPGMNDAIETIHFEWPAAFLAFALVGGGVGGLAAQLSRRGRRRSVLVRATVVGMLIGFTVAVVYAALGLSLIAMKIPAFRNDEAAVFAFALLGGALGIPAFVRRRDVVGDAKPNAAAAGPLKA